MREPRVETLLPRVSPHPQVLESHPWPPTLPVTRSFVTTDPGRSQLSGAAVKAASVLPKLERVSSVNLRRVVVTGLGAVTPPRRRGSKHSGKESAPAGRR
jgi:hypothetical protein